jgi:hypothetical protein
MRLNVAHPPRDRAAAIAAALRAHGWSPDAEGALALRLIDDVLMIVDAGGGARELTLYLRELDAHEPLEARRPLTACEAAAKAIVDAAAG